MTMGATPAPTTDCRMRLILRVHTDDVHRELELAVPSTTCLGEIFSEVLILTELAGENHSWQFSTALGLPLSPSTPLEHLPLRHGNVVVMEPRQSYPAPVVRDCADAIGDAAQEVPLRTPVSVTSWILAVVALIALGVQCQIPLWGVATGIAVLGAVLSVWSSLSTTLSVTTLLSSAVAVYLLVLDGYSALPRGESTPSRGSSAGYGHPEREIASALAQAGAQWRDHGLALLCAVGVALLVVSVLTALHRLPVWLSTALLTAGAAGVLGTGALVWSENPLTAASVLLLTSLVTSLKAPAIAIVLARVPLPVLPSAGEDLSVSDIESQEDSHLTATRARALHAGVLSGGGALATVSCFIIALHGGLFAQITCLAAGGAFLVHALRHRHNLPVWSLLVPGLLSVTGIALGSHPSEGAEGTISLALGILVTVVLSTVPLWVERLRGITPTTQMWLERAETLCIATLIPLSAQVAGLFHLIRSLG